MANPTSGWDGIPVFGVFMRAPDDAPELGSIKLTVAARLVRTDGRIVYPAGATRTVVVGDTDGHDATIRSAVRAAWRAADAAAAGEDFDGVAWDTWWDTKIVPAAIFTKFPALDDPDIVNDPDNRVIVKEQLVSAAGREYAIQPLLAHLDLAIPGVNLGTIEVPPGAPLVPAPFYAKGIAGGVASLDGEGKVPLDQLPDDIGGGGIDEAALATYLVEHPQAPAAFTVTDGKVATNAAIALSKTADSTASGGRLALTNAERSKLGALPADAQSASQVDSRADARITAFVGAAPGALNTLDELAAALGDDANFAATVTAALATKASAAALAGKAAIGLSYPIVSALTSTVVPDRSDWIAANCPGYSGPLIWNTLMFVDFPKATIEAQAIDGDIAWRRVSS